MQKAFYNISEMAAMLGLTVSAIHGHLSRKNYSAVPPPIHLGRRLAWPAEVTETWVRQRSEAALTKMTNPEPEPRRIGRPTKAELRARKRKQGLD